jgi:hypothetical protein
MEFAPKRKVCTDLRFKGGGLVPDEYAPLFRNGGDLVGFATKMQHLSVCVPALKLVLSGKVR